jgi:hypothetical protein
MKFSDFLQDIGRPIAYYPSLAFCLGSIPAAILCAQLVYWYDKARHEYLYKTYVELENETGLSMKQLRAARAILEKKGIISFRFARLLHETHYILHIEILDKIWDAWVKEGKKRVMMPQRSHPKSGGRKRRSGVSTKMANGELPKWPIAASPNGK